MLESMIKSLVSVIKILKVPEDGFSISWLHDADQARSKKFFRDLIGQSVFWSAQHGSNVRPTP